MEDDIEIQFSPSKWSKRFPTDNEVIANHIQLTANETQKNVKKYNYKSNISYGLLDRENYDIYFKNDEIGSPIFVYVHGGYWQELNKNISGYCVAPFVELGYRVIIVGYNLCPAIKLNEIIEQINKAFTQIFIYANQTQAKEISICGHSAGAHLIASSLLYQPEKFSILFNTNILKTIFLISGIYNLTELWRTKSVNNNNILGLNDISAIKLSPIYNDLSAVKDYFKFLNIFVYVGENDSPKFKEQSESFYRKLLHSNLNGNFKVFQNYDHFDIVEHLNLETNEITKCILENL